MTESTNSNQDNSFISEEDRENLSSVVIAMVEIYLSFERTNPTMYNFLTTFIEHMEYREDLDSYAFLFLDEHLAENDWIVPIIRHASINLISQVEGDEFYVLENSEWVIKKGCMYKPIDDIKAAAFQFIKEKRAGLQGNSNS